MLEYRQYIVLCISIYVGNCSYIQGPFTYIQATLDIKVYS